MNVCDHLTAVAIRGQKLSGEFVERDRLGAGHLESVIDRRCYRKLGQCGNGVTRSDGLYEGERQANGVASVPDWTEDLAMLVDALRRAGLPE
jgi:hypothetical protein